MLKRFYYLTAAVSRLVGPWFVRIVAWFIAAGHFAFLKRRKYSVEFYSALFSGRGRIYHHWRAWKQYQSFTDVFTDRMFLNEKKTSYTSDGIELIEEALESGKGGILLTSHMGNWEIAAYFLKRLGHRLMLFMGEREKETLEKMQKGGLADSGIEIVTAGMSDQSYALINGLKFLKAGGLVAMSGDRLWTDGQRFVEVSFLEKKARLPEAPHALAMISGAPLIPVFALKTGQYRFHFNAAGSYSLQKRHKRDRNHNIEKSAQDYALLLAGMARKHPDQWYHFDPFFVN
jgi:lauroyl/myristoyl acyltransferase